jgi:hypothetical protein
MRNIHAHFEAKVAEKAHGYCAKHLKVSKNMLSEHRTVVCASPQKPRQATQPFDQHAKI